MSAPIDEWFYKSIEGWVWDRHTKALVKENVKTMKNFVHIIIFACEKQLLESMWSLVTCLQENSGFRKSEEIIHIYKETREKGDELFQFQFQSTQAEAVSPVKEFCIVEKCSKSCGEKVNCNKIPLEAVKVYREKSLYLLFFVIAFAKMKPRLVIEKGRVMKYACSSSSIFKIRRKNSTNVWKINLIMLCHHQNTSMKIWSDEDHFACDSKMIHLCFICSNTQELKILSVTSVGGTLKKRSL